MDDNKLIELVENNDLLYNKLNKNYRIPDKKRQKMWQKISEEMGIPLDLCIKRWSSLRDRYAKEKKNEKLASGSGAVFKHRWQFIQQLEFLAPHVIPRPVRSTINIVDNISTTLDNGSEAGDTSTPDCFENWQSLYNSQLNNTESQEPLSASPVATPQPLQKKRKKKIEQSDESDKILADALETFQSFCKYKQEKQIQNEENAVYGFCKIVSATLNSFNENKQTRAIKQITDILTQLKLEPE